MKDKSDKPNERDLFEAADGCAAYSGSGAGKSFWFGGEGRVLDVGVDYRTPGGKGPGVAETEALFAGAAGDQSDDIAFHGPCRVVASRSRWGGGYSKAYVGKLLNSPTWKALREELAEQTMLTKDLQHVLLEGIEMAQEQPEAGVTHIHLQVGS